MGGVEMSQGDISDDLNAPRDVVSGGRLTGIRKAGLQSRNLEKLTLVIEILAILGLGVLTAWVVVDELRIRGGAVAVACLVIPLLVALTFSDRLSEISFGGGGVNAKFRDAAKRPVKTAVSDAVEPRLAPIEKRNIDWLDSWIAEHSYEYNLPVILSLRQGQKYDDFVFLQYVVRLNRTFPKFAFVAILDKSGSHIGHMSPKVILGSANYNVGINEGVPLINRILDDVRECRTEALFKIDGIRRETVTPATQLVQALRIMRDLRVEELLVVNSLNSPSGVLEQTAVLRQLVLELTS
jgi:hypothetical protein